MIDDITLFQPTTQNTQPTLQPQTATDQTSGLHHVHHHIPPARPVDSRFHRSVKLAPPPFGRQELACSLTFATVSQHPSAVYARAQALWLRRVRPCNHVPYYLPRSFCTQEVALAFAAFIFTCEIKAHYIDLVTYFRSAFQEGAPPFVVPEYGLSPHYVRPPLSGVPDGSPPGRCRVCT